jgi:hypothetical protein
MAHGAQFDELLGKAQKFFEGHLFHAPNLAQKDPVFNKKKGPHRPPLARRPVVSTSVGGLITPYLMSILRFVNFPGNKKKVDFPAQI